MKEKIKEEYLKRTRKLLEIKQVDMKEKVRKSILGEPESFSRQNYVAETLSKE